MTCQDNARDEGIMCDFCNLLHPSDYDCDGSKLLNMILDIDRKVNDQWEMNYKSIENISKRLSKVEDDIISLYRKIEFYENSIQRKWQANTELSQRLTKLEEELEPYDLSEHDEIIHDLVNIGAEKRLIRLENHQLQIGVSLDASPILKRLEKLEEMQSSMLSMTNVVWQKYNKMPHMCPICIGHGGTKISGVIDEECHACKGTGIVWG